MVDASAPRIVLAGATGDLGGRVAAALARRGANLRMLVRIGTSVDRRAAIADHGETLEVDFDDAQALRDAVAGTGCVVSAVNGLRDVVIYQQAKLLDAAVAAGVPRFIPSDFALDFTKTAPGGNRNLDLRREFMRRLDRAPIRATSILNGGFADLLAGDAPMILHRWRRVLYWGDADQPLDFTTKDDVADFTAAAALDPATPRILRIAGMVVTPRSLAATMSTLSGTRYRPLRAGGVGMLSAMIAIAKRVAPQPRAVFPAWQGMQYLRDMASGRGKLEPLDNDRYPDIRWTGERELLARLPTD